MILRLTTFHENIGIGIQPSPPWGRGWPAPAFSPGGAGRVRGSPEASAVFMAKNLGSYKRGSPTVGLRPRLLTVRRFAAGRYRFWFLLSTFCFLISLR
jgi:hypothetical protein